MSIEELNQYRSVVREIEEVRTRLEKSKVCQTVVGSQQEFPFVKRSIKVGGITHSDENAFALYRLRKLKSSKREIESFVCAIHDSIVRRAVELRYIVGEKRPSWEWVARRIGGGNSADSIRKSVTRYLAKSRKNQ